MKDYIKNNWKFLLFVLSSGLSGSERDIKKTCPGAVVKSGLSITGSNAAGSGNKVKKWLSANGLA